MNNLRLFPKHPSFRRSSSSDEDSPTRRPGASSGGGGGGGGPAHSVKRALFGPTDHEENLRFASQEMKRHREEAAHRWNFNFETGRPLKGRYAWKEEAALLAVDEGSAAAVGGTAAVLPLGSVRLPPPTYLPPPASLGGGFDGTAEQAERENRENNVGSAAVVSSSVGRRLPPFRPSSSLVSTSSSSCVSATPPLPPSGTGMSAATSRLSSSSMRFSSSSPFTAVASVDHQLLAGPPAGSLDDLRTPAPPASPPPLTAGVLSTRGAEGSADETMTGGATAAAARLSDSNRDDHQGGARPKTKEQKITDAFKSRKARSKSSSRLRALKRLDAPRPAPSSRSPSVKSRGATAAAAHRSPTSSAVAGRSGYGEGAAAAAATEACNSD